MEDQPGSPAARGPNDRAGAHALVQVKDLHFRYDKGTFGLRVPRLSLYRQESAALIGPSGSGKTTMVHLLAGLLPAQSGSIEAEGLDLSGLSERDRRDFRALRVGLVFQEFELLDYLSLRENILLPYRINALLHMDAATRERADELAEAVGLADKLERLPGQLSQGERQRIAVCRALLTRPRLVFGDEPTGNLDMANRDIVMNLLFAYCREEGATLLLVTHDPALQERCDRRISITAFQHG